MIINPKYPPKPKGNGNLTNREILFGQPIPVIDRLKVMSEDDFENLTLEWIDGFLIKNYELVEKFGGAGDKGRDVVAHIDTKSGIWENYQCKHYDHPLMPNEVYIELGKIIYYSFIGDYNPPCKYYFVTPQGVGAKLSDLLRNNHVLKQELLNNWNDKCKNDITKTNEIPLDSALTAYIDSFDFTIFSYIPPLNLINQHRETVYHAARFGGGLTKKRPEPKAPTVDIGSNEIRYVEQLFEAYSDLKKDKIKDIAELKSNYPQLFEHFNRQRISFYSAESLNEFSRDVLPLDSKAFERLKEEIYNAVIDVCNSEYTNGYERLVKTTQEAVKININNNPLSNEISINDKKGVCHHLANEDKLKWT